MNLVFVNEYLVAENRILRDQIKGRVQLSDAERLTLSEIGKKLGKKALEEVAHVVKPDTILGWQSKLAADKLDGSTRCKSPGRPRVDKELEDLLVQMAKENRSWGYDRLTGALAHQGKGNVILFPSTQVQPDSDSPVKCREGLGGLLKYYHRKAA